MTSAFCENLQIRNSLFLDGLKSIIEAVNYDVEKAQKSLYRPEVTIELANKRTSAKALENLIKNDRAIATSDCNLYTFNNKKPEELVGLVSEELKFLNPRKVISSGKFWYPANGYMGWHTNSNNYGYRLYCTHAREDSRSFFRYRDPFSGEIITSWDQLGWTFRLFKISSDLLWHCVYSETDRFSIGYTIFI